MAEKLSKTQIIWLIIFALLTFLLPIGFRYGMYYNSITDIHYFAYRIEFIIPMVIEVSTSSMTLDLLVSALGILLPLFVIIHAWLIMRMTKIVKGESTISSIYLPLLLVTLVSLSGFFPTFRGDWGNIPFPLMLPIGALFAKFAAKPLSSEPFER